MVSLIATGATVASKDLLSLGMYTCSIHGKLSSFEFLTYPS